MTGTMNCIRFYPPGGPEKLQYERCPVPSTLKQDEVLIKVFATGVIWPELYWPIYQRADGTYVPHIPCHDFSGVVVKVGPGFSGSSSNIDIGSEVCAFTSGTVIDDTGSTLRQFEGAAAEYALADADTVVLKPKNLSLLEAASVPLSALTAWQALHEQAQLQKGQKLLIMGAAGATGLWALQMAKMLGVYVVGTASSAWSFETLKRLGIDEVIDYKKQTLEQAVSGVDVVLDTVGLTDRCAKVIKPEGKIVSIVDPEAHEKSANASFFIVSMKRDQLSHIMRLIEEEQLSTFIDSTFPLEETVQAFKKGPGGHLQGKVLIQVKA